MKKLVVNDNCIGCGACVAIDPEHFDFDPDTGLSSVISNDNLESEEVKNAIGSCPANAIKLVDDQNCDCNNCACEDCKCGPECSCHQ